MKYIISIIIVVFSVGCELFFPIEIVQHSDNLITYFAFSLSKNGTLSGTYEGKIDHDRKVIDFYLPYDETEKDDRYTASVAISPKAVIFPNPNKQQSYTNPMQYHITAEDGTRRSYTVNVHIVAGSILSNPHFAREAPQYVNEIGLRVPAGTHMETFEIDPLSFTEFHTYVEKLNPHPAITVLATQLQTRDRFVNPLRHQTLLYRLKLDGNIVWEVRRFFTLLQHNNQKLQFDVAVQGDVTFGADYTDGFSIDPRWTQYGGKEDMMIHGHMNTVFRPYWKTVNGKELFVFWHWYPDAVTIKGTMYDIALVLEMPWFMSRSEYYQWFHAPGIPSTDPTQPFTAEKLFSLPSYSIETTVAATALRHAQLSAKKAVDIHVHGRYQTSTGNYRFTSPRTTRKEFIPVPEAPHIERYFSRTGDATWHLVLEVKRTPKTIGRFHSTSRREPGYYSDRLNCPSGESCQVSGVDFTIDGVTSTVVPSFVVEWDQTTFIHMMDFDDPNNPYDGVQYEY